MLRYVQRDISVMTCLYLERETDVEHIFCCKKKNHTTHAETVHEVAMRDCPLNVIMNGLIPANSHDGYIGYIDK